MNLSEKITQSELQEILVYAYIKGMENKNLKIEEMVEDIKRQLLAVKN
ncbi:hypothetical protein M3610_07315 [Neobacillus sp. MER 74]|nr:hypothetical protein [Neobacillus sp. MER 74]MCM3115095.1 hypothetical protein [Neobacillus sp. MER 74]